MHTTEHRIVSGITAVVLVAIVFSGVARASLVVESAVTRVGIVPGGTWSGTVSIANTSDEPLELSVGVVNLERTEEGTSVPLVNQSDEVVERTLAGWITTVDALTVEPQSRARVPVRIAVPLFASPGLHLAAVLFELSPPGDASGIQVTAATGAALEVMVAGESEYKVSLVSFGPSQRLYTRGPVPVSAIFANHGSTVAELTGELKTVSLLKSVKASVDISQQGPDSSLLPGSERTFELSSDVGPGLYRAELDVSDGIREHRKTVLFVVLPWPIMLVLLAALAAAGMLTRLGVNVLIRRRK